MSCPECLSSHPRSERAGKARRWLALAAVASAVVTLTFALSGAELGRASARSVVADGGPVRVSVGADGFAPSSIRVPPGKNVEIVFTRTSEETCASSVVFPELGIERELPLRTPVTIAFFAERERTLSMQCGVGDHRSAVIVQ